MARCTGRTKARKRCKRPAVAGSTRCPAHPDPVETVVEPPSPGGSVVVLAGRVPVVMGVPLEISPQDAILECIRIAAGEVAYASERIAELQAEAALGPVRRSMVRKSDESGTVQEQRLDPPALHKWIVVRQEAMDRLTHYATLAVGLKLAVPRQQKDAIHAIADELAARRTQVAAGVPRTANPSGS